MTRNAKANELEITPRVIIYKRSLRVKDKYEQIVVIKNNGLYPRILKYSTDSPLDTIIEITKAHYLQPDETLQITIHFQANNAKNINRRRHIYIESEHPNITFEIPIIVVVNDELSMPESIAFSRSSINTTTFYEFTIYNSSKQNQSVLVKCLNTSLRISPEKTISVTKKDYAKVLLSLHVKDMKLVNDEIKIKPAKGPYSSITIEHQPIRYSIYLNTANINFEQLKFERTSQREFTICNDSQLEIHYTIEFLNKKTESKSFSGSISRAPRTVFNASNESDWNSQDSLEILGELVNFQDFQNKQSYEEPPMYTRTGVLQPVRAAAADVPDEHVRDDFDHFYVEEAIADPDRSPNVSVSQMDMSTQTARSNCSNCSKLEEQLANANARIQQLQAEQLWSGNVSLDMKPGTNPSLVSAMARCVAKLPHVQKVVQIQFDAIGLTPNLTYNSDNDIIDGLNDLGGTSRLRQVATKAKFFVAASLVGNFSLLLGYYVYNQMTTFDHAEILRKTIRLAESIGLTVVATMCDQGRDNIALYKDIQRPDCDPPCLADHHTTIYLLHDPHHCFRNIRNLFLRKTATIRHVTVAALETLANLEKGNFFRMFQCRPHFFKTNIGSSIIQQFELDFFDGELVNALDTARSTWNLEGDAGVLLANCGPTVENLRGFSVVWQHICETLELGDERWDNDFFANDLLFLESVEIPSALISCVAGLSAYLKGVLKIRKELQRLYPHFPPFVLSAFNMYGLEEFLSEIHRTAAPTGTTVHRLRQIVSRQVAAQLVDDNRIGDFRLQHFKFPPLPKWKLRLPRTLPPVRLLSAEILLNERAKPSNPQSRQICYDGILRKYPLLDTAEGRLVLHRELLFFANYFRQHTEAQNFERQLIDALMTHTTQEFPNWYLDNAHRVVLQSWVTEQVTVACDKFLLRIPITYKIEGMPIYFEPLIENGLDAGVLLMTTKENVYADIPNFSKDIKVINRGRRTYRLIITKLKSSSSKCEAPPVKGRLNITPKSILMNPGTETYLNVTANAFEETTVYNEFRINILDQLNRKKFHNIRFVAKAKFIRPELHWHPKEICMNYYRTHRFKEHPQMEIVKLINMADVSIDTINLKVYGPFRIKAFYEHKFAKEVEFKMNGLEKKDITILLNKAEIKDNILSKIEGRIVCLANATVQKSLPLKVMIFSPALKISQPNLIIFTKYAEGYAFVEIENIGCLEALYKWKKIAEYTEYIEYIDDANAFSREILSDILGALDLSEYDSLNGSNMPELFQTYRCKLKHLPDKIGIKFIIDGVIDQLDLQHKRYMLHLDSNDEVLWRSFECEPEQVLNEVIGTLKLEDSFTISEPNSDDCFKERTAYFYEKSGTLREMDKVQSEMHLPAVRRGYALKANFQLDVVGGRTQNFFLTLAHLAKTIDLWKNNNYLGIKPWYELYKCNVQIRNVTPYTIHIRLEESNPLKIGHRIAKGFLKITSDQHQILPMYASKIIRTEGIMGFSEVFTKQIKVLVNYGEEMIIHLRGQGVMPILTVTDRVLSPQELNNHQIVEEYKLLQCMYYFDIFKGITEDEEEITTPNEDENSSLSDYSINTMSSSRSSSDGRRSSHERRWFRLIKTYVLVNYNAQLPNAVIIEQQLETLKFLRRLRSNKDTSALLHLIYHDYVNMKENHDTKMPVNLKHFTVQPLPFHLRGYTLNMNHLKLNQFRRFEIYLQFFGPGKLIASARTAVKIPGLVVDFEVIESFGHNNDIKFIYYASDDKAPDSFDKRYRNMYEREIDLANDPKLKHAHSFDVDSHSRHQREISSKVRKNVCNYYNSLKKSLYMEHKHQFVLCKIFSNSRKNFSGTNLRLIVLIKPQSNFYDEGQLIEDYLYIDLHLGPTLPILLRGMIHSK